MFFLTQNSFPVSTTLLITKVNQLFGDRKFYIMDEFGLLLIVPNWAIPVFIKGNSCNESKAIEF